MQRYEMLLSELERRGRRRALAPQQGADFASNDYLGLAGSPELRAALHEALERGVPAGAGASRLLRGNHPEHEALEAEAARFFGSERTLYFSSGFMANFALWSLLPRREDLVVYDELIHASCHQGMRAGAAHAVAAKHNDACAVDDAIAAWRAGGGTGRPWISVESLYSMDGDCAPLEALAAVAERHDAMLAVDEAHATGVFGPGGRGFAAARAGGGNALAGRENVICLHTCGKALGAQGALLGAPAAMIDFLVNRSRPFIYSTAPSPLMAAAVRAALGLLARSPERRERLHGRIDFANRRIESRCGVAPTRTQLIPVIVGGAQRAMQIARALQSAGFDVRGIRPPTVPEGTSRLRISLTLNVDDATTGAMLDVLADALERHPA
jgi:8-amino-7-oxononanoate synthase